MESITFFCDEAPFCFESLENEKDNKIFSSVSCNKSEEAILPEVNFTQMNEGNTMQKMNALLQMNQEKKP
jgi:hypothetical protein